VGLFEAMTVRLVVERHWLRELVQTLERIVDDGRNRIGQSRDDSTAQIDAHAWAQVNARLGRLRR
jgi:GntR family transcriptional regulator of vanillate catabolism